MERVPEIRPALLSIVNAMSMHSDRADHRWFVCEVRVLIKKERTEALLICRSSII